MLEKAGIVQVFSSIFLLMLTLLVFQPATMSSASSPDVYSPVVKPNEIDAGDTVEFWANIENLNTSSSLELKEMFVEIYEGSSNVSSWNATKRYDDLAKNLPANATKTDVIRGEVDLAPGVYSVIIGFRTTTLEKSGNATLIVRKAPEEGIPLLTATIIGVFIFIMMIFIIGAWGSYKERSLKRKR